MGAAEARESFLRDLPRYRERHALVSLYPPPGDDALTRFRQEFGFELPIELHEWLGLVNGCHLNEIITVASFLPLREGFLNSSRDLEDVVQLRQSHLKYGWPTESRAVPFADDGCGNMFLLVPAPTGDGLWVAFNDHESTEPGRVSFYYASNLWACLSGLLDEESTENYDNPESGQWPFNREATLVRDPDMAQCPLSLAPWS